MKGKILNVIRDISRKTAVNYKRWYFIYKAFFEELRLDCSEVWLSEFGGARVIEYYLLETLIKGERFFSLHLTEARYDISFSIFDIEILHGDVIEKKEMEIPGFKNYKLVHWRWKLKDIYFLVYQDEYILTADCSYEALIDNFSEYFPIITQNSGYQLDKLYIERNLFFEDDELFDEEYKVGDIVRTFDNEVYVIVKKAKSFNYVQRLHTKCQQLKDAQIAEIIDPEDD